MVAWLISGSWGEVAKASGGDSFHVALQDRSIAWLVSPFGVLRS
jgi:hypothetical protein